MFYNLRHRSNYFVFTLVNRILLLFIRAVSVQLRRRGSRACWGPSPCLMFPGTLGLVHCVFIIHLVSTEFNSTRWNDREQKCLLGNSSWGLRWFLFEDLISHKPNLLLKCMNDPVKSIHYIIWGMEKGGTQNLVTGTTVGAISVLSSKADCWVSKRKVHCPHLLGPSFFMFTFFSFGIS